MFIVEVPKEILIAGNKSMVHVFKRVSISDEEAEIRFFRVYGTPPCTCQQKLDTKLKKLGIKIEYLYKIQ